MWYKIAQNLATDFPQVAELSHHLPDGLENYAVALMSNMPTPSYAQGKVLDYIKKIHPVDGRGFRVPKMHNHCRCDLIEVGAIPETGETISYWNINPGACPICKKMSQIYNQASTQYLEDTYPKQNGGVAAPIQIEQPQNGVQENEPVEPTPNIPPDKLYQPKQILEPASKAKPKPQLQPVQPMPVPEEESNESLLDKILAPQETQNNTFTVKKLRTRPFKSFI